MTDNDHIQSIFDEMISDIKYVQRNYLLRKRYK